MRFKLSVILILSIFPGLSYALGLGNIETSSGLNEPFEARIALISATADDLAGLKVELADTESFDKAGIERSFHLSKLKFGIQETEKGTDFIRVYSREPIQEPFLNFLIEVTWPRGKLLREYTVLLDPPLYAPTTSIGRQQVSPSKIDEPGPASEEHVVVYDLEYEQKVLPSSSVTRSVPARAVDYTGGDYGPTVTGDTLWSLAAAMRPDNSVSIQQMMFALLRANPDAFINGNINGLKRGEILRMPDVSDIETLDKAEAFARAKTQNEIWEGARMAMTESPAERPVGKETSMVEPPSVADKPVSTPQQVEETDPELRLVTPTEEGVGADQSVSEGMAGTEEEASQELALLNESFEALKLENAELEEKLTDSEEIITDLKRLIELKEDELNTLEEQVKQAAMAAEQAEMIDKEEAVEEEATEEVMVDEPEEVMEDEVEEETMEEKVMEEEPAEEKPEVEAVATSEGIVDQIMGFVLPVIELIKSNLMFVAGGLGALIAIIGLGLFAMRRRSSAEIVEIADSDFPEFDDFDIGDTEQPDVGSEDETVLPGDEEPGEVPGSEEETVLPGEEVAETGSDATQIVSPAAAQEVAAEEPEEDPMSDVNMFLAYEQFDQAEEFVRNALNGEPDNIEFHLKLLEVFYVAGNKKSYEEAAQVLNEKVGGQGEHWDMAVTMWQEISPNRGLFEEPVAGEEEEEQETGTPSGGIVDITGDTEAGVEAGDSDVLDFTQATDLDSEAETLGGAAEVEALDASASDEVLDVTAAVGLDEDEDEEDEDEGGELSLDEADNSLDLSFDESGSDVPEEDNAGDDDVLNITGGADDALDLSFNPEEDSDIELPAGTEEDSLDFSMDEEPSDDGALEMPAEEDSLDISMDEKAPDEGGLEIASEEDSMDLSFDAELSNEEEQEDVSADDESLELSMDDDSASEIDLESSGGDDVLDLTMEAPEEAAEEQPLDVSTNDAKDLLDVTSAVDYEGDSDEDLLDVTAAAPDKVKMESVEDDSDEEEDEALDLSLDSDNSVKDEDSLDLDISTGPEPEDAGELSLDDEIEPKDEAGESEEDSLDLDIGGVDAEEVSTDGGDGEPAFELDLESSIGLSGAEEESEDSNMDETVAMPGLGLSLEGDDEDEEDEDQPTVFVPKSSGTEQQNEEDEIGTQLDLAKAYIELGDNDNAKTILDEIIAQGNEQQRKEAQDLLGQIS